MNHFCYHGAVRRKGVSLLPLEYSTVPTRPGASGLSNPHSLCLFAPSGFPVCFQVLQDTLGGTWRGESPCNPWAKSQMGGTPHWAVGD